MITSDIQLKTAKEQFQLLNSAVGAEMSDHIPQPLIDAHHQKLADDMSKLQSEIDEYERLKSTHFKDIVITNFDDLLKAPIYYRIATRMTVEEFARTVDTSVRQIQRYEASEYQSSSVSNLKKILQKIHIDIKGGISSVD